LWFGSVAKVEAETKSQNRLGVKVSPPRKAKGARASSFQLLLATSFPQTIAEGNHAKQLFFTALDG
jgi:hypothetical protein